ncbi:MAG: DsrE family protein [Hyphomonadaceae bacterium]
MSTVTNNTSDHLYIISNFSALDPDRVATPLVLANCALAAESDAVIWLTMDGVELARQGAATTLPAKSFAPVSELLESFIENGGRIGVCPPCAKSHDLPESELISGAEWVGGAALVELSDKRQTFNF